MFPRRNQLSARFPAHPRSLFVVAESGFGTGLNFLTLWQAFDQFHAAHPEATLQRLHFISFEKFPLTAHDSAPAHQRWPELAHGLNSFRRSGRRHGGCHRLLLDGGASRWTYGFGDINELTDKLDDHWMNRRWTHGSLTGLRQPKTRDVESASV